MRLQKAWLPAGLLMLLLIGWFFSTAPQTPQVYAQTGDEVEETETPKPPRMTKIKAQFTSYHWWLIRYSNNQIACSFSVEHEGTPTSDDIESLCDPTTYEEWTNTKPCSIIDAGSWSNCPGFYLQPLDSSSGEREIEVQLPPPSVEISVTNCNAQSPNQHCTTLPNLLLTGKEPLPNEVIINIQGNIDGEPFQCSGAECSIPLKPTGMDGANVEFWADSSFGDSTEHYTAKVRLVPWGDFMNPEQTSNDPEQWYVDVLSSQLTNANLASCSDTWQVFPDVGGPPEWLTTTDNVQDLETDTSYYYLAGSLITHGVVDAKECPNGGLQAPNIANACGVETARPKLIDWQNRFDQEIIQVSNNTGVPARLLKNVFARESQIWPGIFTTYKEAGLGQLTENGADTVLLWNPDFFSQFCPLVLDKKYCELGFGNLGEYEQTLLRGALVGKVNASCPNCETGIDLSQANYSVNVFAEGLLANCVQVGQIINNITSMSPGQISSYEDLWRFTLVNYNAGAGCLSNAIQSSWDENQPLDWTNVTSHLEPACQGAIGYVEDISNLLKVNPTPTSWISSGENIPTPVLPRVFETPTPTPQPFLRSPTPTSTVDFNAQPTDTPQVTGTPPTVVPTATQPTPTNSYP
jgi:hypothetical protein